MGKSSTSQPQPVESLEDCIVRYDMGLLAKQVEIEFESNVYSQDLVNQGSISEFFNLEEKFKNARN